MKQIYLKGDVKFNSFGDQEFTVVFEDWDTEESLLRTFVFPEGEHVRVFNYVNQLTWEDK